MLVERSVSALVAAARHALATDDGLAGPAGPAGPDDGTGAGDPATTPGDIHDVAAGGLAVGELTSLISPSLFGGGTVVVIRAAQRRQGRRRRDRPLRR